MGNEKEKNLTRFLLTFFLGWIGSIIINCTDLKPKGYKSRSLAYFFLPCITFGIYGLVASICNLTFDPSKPSNIGYYRDYSEPITSSSNNNYSPTKPSKPVYDNTISKMLILGMAIFSFVMLFFNLCMLEYDPSRYGGNYSSYWFLADNGFSFLTFNSTLISIKDPNYGWAHIGISFFSIIFFLISLALIGLSIYNITSKKNLLISSIIPIASIVVSLFYTLIGLLFSGVVKSIYSGNIYYIVSTAAFIPFIIELALFIALQLINKSTNKSTTEQLSYSPAQASQQITAQPIENTKETKASDIEMLEKLANLKNQGLLTDEEFEAKKKQLLGL